MPPKKNPTKIESVELLCRVKLGHSTGSLCRHLVCAAFKVSPNTSCTCRQTRLFPLWYTVMNSWVLNINVILSIYDACCEVFHRNTACLFHVKWNKLQGQCLYFVLVPISHTELCKGRPAVDIAGPARVPLFAFFVRFAW